MDGPICSRALPAEIRQNRSDFTGDTGPFSAAESGTNPSVSLALVNRRPVKTGCEHAGQKSASTFCFAPIKKSCIDKIQDDIIWKAEIFHTHFKGGVSVALEVISAVEEAENSAVKIRSDAKTEAAKIIAQADLKGKETVDAAKKRAADQVAQIFADFDKKADDNIAGIESETGKTQEDLTSMAAGRMDAAVELIKERIIKG